MEILFVAKSKLIMAVTGEEVSHCALKIGQFVVHSNWRGLNIESWEHFREENRVVYRLHVELDANKIQSLLAKDEHNLYDWGALLYLGIRLMAKRYLRIRLPKKNLWQVTGMYMCTEWVSKAITGEELSMITPYQLYLLLREKLG